MTSKVSDTRVIHLAAFDWFPVLNRVMKRLVEIFLNRTGHKILTFTMGGIGRWGRNFLLLLPLGFPLILRMPKENGASYDVSCSLVSAEAHQSGS